MRLWSSSRSPVLCGLVSILLAVGVRAASATENAASPSALSSLIARDDCRVGIVSASCSQVADDAHITLGQLLGFNPGLNCATVQPGDRLCVSSGSLPPLQLPPPGPDGTCRYVEVRENVFCSDYATQCGVTLDQLKAANPGLDCTKLTIKQALCCGNGKRPNRAPKQNPDGTCAGHIVDANDSCHGLAIAYDIKESDIDTWNAQTWRYSGCKPFLQQQTQICLSPGKPHPPPQSPNIQCGQESIGNVDCPLNLCCGKFGFCGQDPEYCTEVKDKPPGNGCQSHCEMEAPKESVVCSNVMKIQVGYYESWSSYRPCMAYRPANINANQWTHLHFAFGSISTDHKVEFKNMSSDPTLLAEMTALKKINSNLKIVFSIGGWAFQNPGATVTRFRDMVATADTRATFINSAVDFMSKNKVDGLDLDWEYPTTPERSGQESDKPNYLALVQEARKVFGSKYTLSIAAPAGYWYLRGFDIAKMAVELDYIVYMTYDLHGLWDYSIPSVGGQIRPHNNMTEIENSLVMIQKAGVPSNKLLLGIGFYGRSFRQVDPNCWEPGICNFQDPGGIVDDNYVNTPTPGTCTRAGGTLANFEISAILESKNIRWQREDATAMTHMIAYDYQDWVAYDTPTTYKMKIDRATKLCLGGIIVWAVDQDDDSNSMSGIVSESAAEEISMDIWETLMDDFLTDGVLGDTYFEMLANRISLFVTTIDPNEAIADAVLKAAKAPWPWAAKVTQISETMSYRIVLANVAKALHRMANNLNNHLKDGQIAEDKGTTTTQIIKLMVGEGNKFFSCKGGSSGKCPTYIDSEDGVTWSYSDKNGFGDLLKNRLKIDIGDTDLEDHKFKYTKSTCNNWGSKNCEGGVMVDGTWHGVPTVNSHGATMNYYGSRAFKDFYQVTHRQAREALQNLVAGDAKKFFNIKTSGSDAPGRDRPGKQVDSYECTDKPGFEKMIKERLHLESTNINYDGLNSDIPGDVKLPGYPVIDKSYPSDPKPTFINMIKSCNDLADSSKTAAGDTAKTAADLGPLIVGAVHQLAVVMGALGDATSYEKSVQAAEDSLNAAKSDFFKSLVSMLVGVFLTALLPGLGALIGASLEALTSINAVASIITSASEAAAPLVAAARTFTSGVTNAAFRSGVIGFARTVYAAMPQAMKDFITKAITAFKSLGKVIACQAAQSAILEWPTEELTGVITGSLVARDAPLTLGPVPLERWADHVNENVKARDDPLTYGPLSLKHLGRRANADCVFMQTMASKRSLATSTYGKNCDSDPEFWMFAQNAADVFTNPFVVPDLDLSNVPQKPGGGYNEQSAAYLAARRVQAEYRPMELQLLIGNTNTMTKDTQSWAANEVMKLKNYAANRGTIECDHLIEIQEFKKVFAQDNTKIDGEKLCDEWDKDGSKSAEIKRIINEDQMKAIPRSINAIKQSMILDATVSSNIWRGDDVAHTLDFLRDPTQVAMRTNTANKIKDVLTKGLTPGSDLEKFMTPWADDFVTELEHNGVRARNNLRAEMRKPGYAYNNFARFYGPTVLNDEDLPDNTRKYDPNVHGVPFMKNPPPPPVPVSNPPPTVTNPQTGTKRPASDGSLASKKPKVAGQCLTGSP
ncbi:hypothetical protein BDZ88DRAFT_433109 [Geranomyces variabilis]|nr:hypothetical protein BDZ88DRAFT_433109 [Geranomyces variabilis]KAJ3134397.1 hypothetical protein HDU90_005010 [Geranomyces variabilis]